MESFELNFLAMVGVFAATFASVGIVRRLLTYIVPPREGEEKHPSGR